MKKENKNIKTSFIPGLTQHLQWLPLLFINSVCGRYPARHPNKWMMSLHNNNAFTLIELLVVVLIIGILAAVAAPQYQAAVDKSRAGQVLSAIKAIQSAEEVFFLQNGYYTPNMEELDVEVADIKDWAFHLMYDNRPKIQADSQVSALRGDLAMVLYFTHSGNALANKPYCWADDNTRARRLCATLGTPDPVAPNERWFL